MPNDILAEFPVLETSAWIKQIEKELKGTELNALNWEVEPGIVLAPFYSQQADTWSQNSAIPVKQSWAFREQVLVNDNPASAQAQVKAALNQGAESLELSFEHSFDSLSSVLEGVFPEMVELSFCGTALDKQPKGFLEHLYQWLQAQGKNTEAYGSIMFHSDYDKLVDCILYARQHLPKFKLVVIDVRSMNDRHGSEQLSFALRNLNELVLALEQRGLKPADIAQQTEFKFAIGDNFYAEIAKLRAWRHLSKLYFNAWQTDADSQPYLAVYTSNTFGADAHKNMVAAAVQALAGTIGTADSLTVQPGANEVFESRIARNVHHLLRFESHLDQLRDAAAGSYYLEQLTDALAKKAWKNFQNTI